MCLFPYPGIGTWHGTTAVYVQGYRYLYNFTKLPCHLLNSTMEFTCFHVCQINHVNIEQMQYKLCQHGANAFEIMSTEQLQCI